MSVIDQAPISFGLEYPETPVLVAALSGVTDGWAPKDAHLCVDSLDERRANIAAEGADDGERVSWLVLPTGRCVCVWSAFVYRHRGLDLHSRAGRLWALEPTYDDDADGAGVSEGGSGALSQELSGMSSALVPSLIELDGPAPAEEEGVPYD